jgi:hypothetical protein
MILCWLNERLGPRYAGPFAAVFHTHTRSCAFCRKSESASAKLESLLQRQSKTASIEPSPFLSARIVKNLQNATSEKVTRLGIGRLMVRLALPAAASMLIALVLLNTGSTKHPSPTQSARYEQPLPQAKPLLPAFPEISIKVADPLTTEMESLIADSRIAARSLAANFLPESQQP